MYYCFLFLIILINGLWLGVIVKFWCNVYNVGCEKWYVGSEQDYKIWIPVDTPGRKISPPTFPQADAHKLTDLFTWLVACILFDMK